MPKEVISIRLEPDLIARMDEASTDVGRGTFIRAAILAALADDQPKPKAPAKPSAPAKTLPDVRIASTGEPAAIIPKHVTAATSPTSGRWDADDAAILDALSTRRMTERSLAQHLGWAEMRVSKGLARLGSRIVAESGLFGLPTD